MKIETYSGVYFDYAEPSADDVRVEDVARALSHVCRFGGHTARFYSVAEHALLVRRLVYMAGRPDLGLAALHHDSHEAYLGDVPTPLKLELGDELALMADRVDAAVGEAIGVDPALFHHPAVKAADLLALRIEASVLKRSGGVGGAWTLGDDPVEVPEGWEPGLSMDAAEAAFTRAHLGETRSRAVGRALRCALRWDDVSWPTLGRRR